MFHAARADSGFTLVEALVAMSLTLIATTAALDLVNPAMAVQMAEPAVVDAQQRARVAAEAIASALASAGTGAYATPQRGSLAHFLPPVVPRRLGASRPDPFTAARADVVTVLSVPDPWSGAGLAAPLTDPASALQLRPRNGCPDPVPSCGLAAGSAALVFDATGRFATFTVAGAGPASAQLIPRERDAAYPFAAGASVAPLAMRTYYFDEAAHQLREYDGAATDVTVVDHVVALALEYYGEPAAPIWPKPPAGVGNCLYDDTGAARGGLPWLPPAGASLAPLPLSTFSDGPWCGSGDTRFDADLLRIRAIRVAIRVEAVADTVRAQGADYMRGGTARSAWTGVPDVTARFDIVPRNLNLGR